VIIAETIEPDDAISLAARLESELAQPFLLTAGVARIGGSVGVAHGDHHSTPDSLLATADTAMYEAKRRHRIPRRSDANTSDLHDLT
jgi:GGDEF domain-containing protein